MRAEPFSLGGMPALRWGRPSRQGILYLHGQGGSKAEAAFFAAAAADAGWQTVSVDLPGHGDRETEKARTFGREDKGDEESGKGGSEKG